MSDMSLPDAVAHDRQVRRKMSRKAYAELVGITEGRVHALEHGRKIKDGEADALSQYIGDLTDLSAPPQKIKVDQPPSKRQTSTETDPPIVAEPTTGEENWEARRNLLAADYMRVYNDLNGRIPPMPWPSMFRIETVPPVEFPAIRQWLNEVAGWLAEQDGTTSPLPSEEASWISQEPVEIEQEPQDFGDGDEWVEPEVGETPAPLEAEIDDIPPAPILTPSPAADQFPVPQAASPLFQLDPGTWYVTNGELQTFKDCERRWYLSSYLQLGTGRKKLIGSAAIGTRFHESLATWYQPEPGDPWETFNAGVFRDRQILEGQDAHEDTMKQFEQEVDLVRAMLEGYFDWVSETSADVGIRVIASESVIAVDPKIPGHESARLLSKLDAEIELERDESRAFIDHKTGDNFTAMIKGLQLDEQMQHYNLIRYLQIVEQNLHTQIRVAGAIYNMARRVKRTAKAEPPFYGRETVQFNMEQIRSYWLRVKGTMDKIVGVRQRLDSGADHREVVPPRPDKNTCFWKCEFFTLCPMMDHSPAGAHDYMNEALVQVNPLARYEPDAVGVTM